MQENFTDYQPISVFAKDSSPRLASSPQAIFLRCPHCGTNIDNLNCSQCAFQMTIDDGVVLALPSEIATYYAQFIADYEYIRTMEGRGSQNEAFYMALPYKDTSGHNSTQWKIRSRSYDHLIRCVLKPFQKHGSILDLGAGNCWMSFRLAQLGYAPVAVDLLTNEHDGLGAGAHFNRHLSIPLPRFQAEATHLPFRNEQFEAIIFNASFHYSEDYDITLSEALRCLKIGGILIISDTPWYSKDKSGRQMVAERHAVFKHRFGTASDSIKSLEYLTDERLRALAEKHLIRWTVHRPWYGLKWAIRPWIAKLKGRREPSCFRIYVARKRA